MFIKDHIKMETCLILDIQLIANTVLNSNKDRPICITITIVSFAL